MLGSPLCRVKEGLRKGIASVETKAGKQGCVAFLEEDGRVSAMALGPAEVSGAQASTLAAEWERRP